MTAIVDQRNHTDNGGVQSRVIRLNSSSADEGLPVALLRRAGRRRSGSSSTTARAVMTINATVTPREWMTGIRLKPSTPKEAAVQNADKRTGTGGAWPAAALSDENIA